MEKKHLQHLRWKDLEASFPWHLYLEMRPNQKEALVIVSDETGIIILELPTGTGKTAIGYTFLKALERKGFRTLFYIAPTKAIVEQVKKFHPDVKVVYGRNEYPCLYYKDVLSAENVNAEEAPCSMLECPHMVNMETGKTELPGIEPCPYLWAKYQAKGGGIVACTISFYLYTQLFTKEFGEPAGVVVDEVHKIANVVRNSLSYEITDFHLKRVIELLEENDIEESQILERFLKKMIKIVKRKPTETSTLLEDSEVRGLLSELVKIDAAEFIKKIRAVVRKTVNPVEKRDVLKRMEMVVRNLTHYLHSLEYSLKTDEREPLNYTYAFYKKELEENERIQHRLFIRAYSVGSLIRKILSPSLTTLAYSATIGDVDAFGFETGIKGSFFTLPSDFPPVNTMVFIPIDTPNLAVKSRRRQDVTRTLRKIAKACLSFSKSGQRCLMIVISNKERDKFLTLCEEEGVNAISYGNGTKPREAVSRFKAGEGDVLVGTAANYGEGIDLPQNLAPVIFFLRPGYPNPKDPASVFEERRWGSQRWKVWNWRVMIEALQVRGRNIRSKEDKGVTIFISQQFRGFIPAILPEWVRESYKGDMKFEECIKEAKKLLK